MAVRCRGQPTTENSLSPEREESATVHAASVLPHHLSGTVYHDTPETMTLVANNSVAIWRHFYLHGPTRRRCLWERLFKGRFINGSYKLLTYIAMVIFQLNLDYLSSHVPEQNHWRYQAQVFEARRHPTRSVKALNGTRIFTDQGISPTDLVCSSWFTKWQLREWRMGMLRLCRLSSSTEWSRLTMVSSVILAHPCCLE